MGVGCLLERIRLRDPHVEDALLDRVEERAGAPAQLLRRARVVRERGPGEEERTGDEDHGRRA